MTTWSRRGILLLAGLMVATGTGAAAMGEHIGSWVLSCPADAARAEGCRLRVAQPFIDRGGITGDLDVEGSGRLLVPVVVLRGVPREIAMAAVLAGKTEASMQFAGGAREDLVCAADSAGFTCSPQGEARETLAAGLASARSVTVRMSFSVPGLKPLPVRERSFELSGTKDALTRLRAAGPTRVPSPLTALASQTPAGLTTMAEAALKAAGYPNGVADLWALLAKYSGK